MPSSPREKKEFAIANIFLRAPPNSPQATNIVRCIHDWPKLCNAELKWATLISLCTPNNAGTWSLCASFLGCTLSNCVHRQVSFYIRRHFIKSACARRKQTTGFAGDERALLVSLQQYSGHVRFFANLPPVKAIFCLVTTGPQRAPGNRSCCCWGCCRSG